MLNASIIAAWLCSRRVTAGIGCRRWDRVHCGQRGIHSCNLDSHRESMQTPHREAPDWIWTLDLLTCSWYRESLVRNAYKIQPNAIRHCGIFCHIAFSVIILWDMHFFSFCMGTGTQLHLPSCFPFFLTSCLGFCAAHLTTHSFSSSSTPTDRPSTHCSRALQWFRTFLLGINVGQAQTILYFTQVSAYENCWKL